MKFEILGKLPGLNEIIQEAKKGKGKYQPYAEMKRQYTDEITWLAKKLPSYGRVDIEITWHEPNIKRDPDNIMVGQKFILDALVHAGTIQNDNQKYINSITHRFDVDRENPRIEVELKEVAEYLV